VCAQSKLLSLNVSQSSARLLLGVFETISIIAAEASIANVVGMTQMSPPVKDLRE
jgi:hypothetical protein